MGGANRDFRIALELAGAQKFLQDGRQVDVVVQQLTSAFSALSKVDVNLDLSKLKLPNFSKLGEPSKVREMATALSPLASSLTRVNKAVTGNNIADSLSTIFRAITTGNASAIQKRGEALDSLSRNLQKIGKVGNLTGLATTLTTIFTSITSGGNKLAKDISEMGKAINSFVLVIARLNKLSASANLVKSIANPINQIAIALRDLSPKNIGVTPQEITNLSTAIASLGKAFRSFTIGKNIGELPKILPVVVKGMNDIINVVTNLGHNTAPTVNRISQLSKALSDLASAFKSFAATSSGTAVLGNIDTLIGRVVASMTMLNNAFTNNNGFKELALGIAPVSQGLKALSDTITSLARRQKSIDAFPQNLQKISQALTQLNPDVIKKLGDELQRVAGPLRDLASIATKAGGLREFNKNLDEQKKKTDAATASLKWLISTYTSIFSTIGRLLPMLTNLATTLIKLPWQVASRGATAFKNALVFPVNVVISGLKAVGNAITTLYGGLRSAAVFLVKIQSEFNLFGRAINVLLSPFKALISIMQFSIKVMTQFLGIVGRVASAINPFSRSSQTASKGIESSGKAAKTATNDFKQYGDQLNRLNSQDDALVNGQNQLGQAVSGSGRLARVAAAAFSILAGVLVSRGVMLAVNRFLQLQLGLRALTTITQAAGAGLQRLGQFLSNLGQQAFTAISNFENLNLSISTLTARDISTEQNLPLNEALDIAIPKAQEYISIMEQMAIASPYNTADIANGFKLAQTYGFQGDEALALTQVVTNLAAGMNLAGHEISGIILPLGQMSTIGRASLEDLKQLSERGVPVFRLLQDVINEGLIKDGKSAIDTDTFFKAISDGAIPAAAAIEAVRRAQEELGNAAERSQGTFTGLVNALTEMRDIGLRNFFTSSFEAFKPFAEELLNFLQNPAIIERTKQLGAAFGVTVKNALDRLVFAGQFVFAFFQSIPAPIMAAITSALKFAAVVAGVVLGLGVLQTALTAAISVLFLLVNPLNILIGLAVALGVALVTNAGPIMEFFSQIGESIGQLPKFIDALLESIGELGSVGDTIAGDFEGFTGILQILGNEIVSLTNFFFTLGTAFQNIISTGSSVNATFNNMSQPLATLGNGIVSVGNYVVELPGRFGTSFSEILSTISSAVTQSASWFQTMLTSVASWGSSLISEFANGIISAISIVADALSQLGAMITYWLAPGSPPRLLPDIDQWGTAAAEEFLGGFGLADLDLIDDYADNIESLLKNLTFEPGTVDLAGITQLFSEAFNAGEFDTGFYDEINRLSGRAADDVLSLTEKYAAFALEQKELNRLTEEYNKALKEAQGTLDELDSTETIDKNSKSIESLTKLLDNQFLSAESRAATQRKIDRLTAENRIEGLKGTISAQEASVKAAEEALKTQQKQLEIAGRFGEEEGMGGGGGGLGDKIAKEVKEKVPKEKALKEDLKDLLSGIEFGEGLEFKPPDIQPFTSSLTSGLEEAKKKVTESFQGITEQYNRIRDTIANWYTFIGQKLADFGITADRVKAILMGLAIVAGGSALIGGLSAIATAIAPLLTPLGLIATLAVGAATGFSYLVLQTGSITGAFNAIKTAITQFSTAFSTAFGLLSGTGFEGFTGLDFTSFASFGASLGILAAQIETQITTFVSGIREKLQSLLSGEINIGELLQSALSWVGETFPGIASLFTSIGTAITDGIGIVTTAIGNFVEGMKQAFIDKLMSFTGLINVATFINDFIIQPIVNGLSSDGTMLGKVAQAYINLYSGLAMAAATAFASTASGGITTAISAFFNTQLGQIINANINDFVAKLFGAENFDFSSFVMGIGSALESLLTIVQNAIAGIIAAINSPLLQRIIAINVKSFETLIQRISQPQFIAALQSIANGLLAVGSALVIAADFAILSLFEGLATAIENLGPAIDLIFLGISKLASGDITGGLDIIKGLFDGISGILDGIGDIVAGVILKFLELFGVDINSTVLELWGMELSISDIVNAVADAVVSFMGWPSVLGRISAVWGKVSGVFKPTFAFLGTWIPKVIGFFGELITKVGGLNNFLTILSSVGLIAGMWINNAFSAIVTTVQNVISWFTNLGTAISDWTTNANAKLLEWETALQTGFANVGTVIAEWGAGVAESVSGWVEGAKSNVLGFFSTIVTGFTLAKLSVSNFVTNFSSKIKEIITGGKDAVDGVVNAIKDGLTPSNILSKITAVHLKVMDFMTISDDAEAGLAQTIASYLPNADAILGAGGTERVALTLADFITISETEAELVRSAVANIGTALDFMAKVTFTALQTGFQAIVDFFTGQSTFQETLTVFKGLLEAISTALSVTFSNVFATVEPVITELVPFAQPLATAFGNISKYLATKFSNVFSAVAPVIEKVAPFATSFDNALSSIKTLLSGQWSNPFSGLLDSISSLYDKTLGLLNILPGLGGGEVESSAVNPINESASIEVAEKGAKNIAASFISAFDAEVAKGDGPLVAIQNLVDSGTLDTSAAIALAETVGADVSNGVALGIASGKEEVNSAGAAMTLSLILAAKDELKIKSPSAVARDEIGLPIPQGIALGILQGSPVVGAAINLMLLAMKLQFQNGLKGLTSAGGNSGNGTSVFDGILKPNPTLLDEIKTFLSEASSLFTAFVDEVNVTLTNFSSDTITIFEEMYEEIMKLTKDFIDEYLGKIRDLVDDTLSEFRRLKEETIDLFREMYEAILEDFDAFADDLLDRLEELSNDVIDELKDLIRRILLLKTDFQNAGKQLGEALVNAIKKAISDGAESVRTEIKNIFTWSLDFTGAIGTRGETLGRRLVQGIIKGIKDNREQFIKALEDLIDDGVEAAAKRAKIESPSKVFRDEIGVPLVQGMVLGIQSQRKSLIDTTVSLMDASVLAAKQALDIHSPSRVAYSNIGQPYVQGIVNAMLDGKGLIKNSVDDIMSGMNGGIESTELPIDVRYNGLISALPDLAQVVHINQKGLQKSLRNDIRTDWFSKMFPNIDASMLGKVPNVQPNVSIVTSPYQEKVNSSNAFMHSMNQARNTTISNSSVNTNISLQVNSVKEGRKVLRDYAPLRLRRST